MQIFHVRSRSAQMGKTRKTSHFFTVNNEFSRANQTMKPIKQIFSQTKIISSSDRFKRRNTFAYQAFQRRERLEEIGKKINFPYLYRPNLFIYSPALHFGGNFQILSCRLIEICGDVFISFTVMPSTFSVAGKFIKVLLRYFTPVYECTSTRENTCIVT